MKSISKIFLLIVIIGTISSCRQAIVPNELLPKFDSILEDPTQLTEYEFSEGTPFKHIALAVEFGSNKFKDSTILAKLENTHIKYITYVYSDFKSDSEFKQEELNRERLFNLFQYLPELFDSNLTEWKTIKQTGAKSEKEAKELFHGYAVYYRPAPTKESMEAEIAYMESLIDTALTFIAPISDTSHIVTEIRTSAIIEFEEGGSEAYYDSDVAFEVADSVSSSETGTFDFGNYFQDTTVSAVLNRNKDWNKMLINCDLTGSMSPYSTQLLVWHRLNIDKNKVQHFVFFNDGDMTPDNKKVAGSTGGIYYSQANDFEKLKEVAYKCMRSGGGGDAPENDIEAMLKGFKKCKDCGDVILIADNWANMRDYEFINKIDRPVRIILCGTQFGINKQYLDLARATKGSVHTIEEDISNLMDLKEGEEITISGRTFVIENGKFIEVKKI
ncbi:hypothetical protein G3O08_20370 [Cryomorpha ignava]|uniref:VWA domain-containing protein n=1 Tax=Cryomorpha ignava TaxID=101383 RepID=A0A7K3WVX5_9FLAO|nr:hypothetical protein [Cryomorpha ignava]NEN25849.1 hypothetical protein [Cryomorpha ignava]